MRFTVIQQVGAALVYDEAKGAVIDVQSTREKAQARADHLNAAEPDDVSSGEVWPEDAA